MPSGRACTGSPFDWLAAASIASANRPSAAQVASSGAATVVAKYPVTPWVVEKLAQARQFGRRCPHHIQPSSAVHVDIEKAGRQHGVAEIDQRGVDGNFFLDAEDSSAIRPSSTMSSGFWISSTGV